MELNIILVEDHEALLEMIKQEKKVLVDFQAKWCPPCRLLHPILLKLASVNKALKVVEIDCDTQKDIAEHYDVASIPTLLLFENGELVKRHTGFMPMEKLKEWIK